MTSKRDKAIELIKRGRQTVRGYKKFALEEMLQLAKSVDNEHVWTAIISNNNLDASQLLSLGFEANSEYVWKKILKTRKLSHKQVVIAATEANSWVLWQNLIFDFNFDIELLIEISQKINDFNPEETMLIWDTLIPKLELESKTPEELLEIGHTSNTKRMWGAIGHYLSPSSFSEEALNLIANKINEDWFWQKIEAFI